MSQDLHVMVIWKKNIPIMNEAGEKVKIKPVYKTHSDDDFVVVEVEPVNELRKWTLQTMYTKMKNSP